MLTLATPAPVGVEITEEVEIAKVVVGGPVTSVLDVGVAPLRPKNAIATQACQYKLSHPSYGV